MEEEEARGREAEDESSAVGLVAHTPRARGFCYRRGENTEDGLVKKVLVGGGIICAQCFKRGHSSG